MVIRKPGDARASEVSGTAGRLARLEKAMAMKDRAAKIALIFRACYGDELSEVADACEGDRLFVADYEDKNETSN